MLHVLLIPDRPWDNIAIDFIFDLPRTPTKNVGIWTIIDQFSKAPFNPIWKKIEVDHMVKLFIQNIFKHHGLLESHVRDQDPCMTSLFL